MSGADFDQDRWSSPQGNVTGLGIVASYSARFWTLVIGLGVITGLAAAGLIGLLRLVERVSYGVHRATLLAAVEAAPGWRRIVVLMVAAVIVILGLRVLRRSPDAATSTGATEVTEAIWLRSGRLDFLQSIARGVLSIVTVAMGVSLGREGAPQVVGAAFASRVSEWAAVPVWQRRLLVASGAGAGFAAVYDVPLGGALFALEVMLGTLALPLVLPALLMSLSATAMAWIFLGTKPLYHVAIDRFHPAELVFAILMGPIIGLVATGWTRLIAWATRRRPQRAGRWFAPAVAFGVLALLSLQYPQLLGNGRGIAQLGITGNIGLGLLVMLLLLKPLVTAACVASGSPGGLFTPTFAFGVLLAGVGGALWAHVWHGGVPGSYALIGGAAFLAVAMQAPLAGTVLVLEMTNHFQSLVLPTLVAVIEATVLSRKLGAASIYSARLRKGGVLGSSPPADVGSAAAIGALDEDPRAGEDPRAEWD
ncbi:MAG: chloride channel protein [Acidobacteriota bacterium]|nr:chloride channel protein [Acidobacteriota bacterium]